MSHSNEVELVANGGWDERILVCRNAPLVTTFIVITTRYVVVVDTMINEVTAGKLLDVARPYLTDGRSLLIINTHADYDHSWGNQLFAAMGVPIIGRRASVPIFSEPDTLTFLQRVQTDEPGIFGNVIPTPPTILFDDKLTIDGGDLTLELFATPGHTVDHTALYIPEINTLLAADAAEAPYPVARTTAGLPVMRQSLAKLAAIHAETALYCHAPTDIGPQLLHDNITYFDKLEAACRAALARGVPANPAEDADVIELVGLPYAQAVPQIARWQNIHEYYRTRGHAAQLRMMLESVSRES
ncbi:MAG: MBL fold metallo-hydrolase [Ardenticatenaceae bacterium]|nr:MBL fold metallo-hydrolase [Anaerolineales bacterium]MCB8921220.1 MBL fold metallo-hydrolase [Ardenticatenaceae bacterium]MCB9004294.1 MBL fold metallo-hydrolase [Ardenticatenaceae bacterium]